MHDLRRPVVFAVFTSYLLCIGQSRGAATKVRGLRNIRVEPEAYDTVSVGKTHSS